MAKAKSSETITSNIFRTFHKDDSFIEASAIPDIYGFMSKRGTASKGYPDFFKDSGDFSIVVEAKATNHKAAEKEVKFYMATNNIQKDIIGIAISGQKDDDLKITYYYKRYLQSEINTFPNIADVLLKIVDLEKSYKKIICGELITTEALITVLKSLNKQFHDGNKVRDSDRSLFFSGIMIALNSNNFRSTYKGIQKPSDEELATTKAIVLEAFNLNAAIIQAIAGQLKSKINNLSKAFNWHDKFSFIKNIDFSLDEYKKIINTIETKIFLPFKNDEKQDILGRAYKIFLERAGKAENKNIILTPDHIKGLMVKLARLTKDDVVLDTCTGSGGFLMESMEVMTKLALGNAVKIDHIKEKQLIGFEIDSVLFSLACSNLFLHGDGRTNLLYRSSLLNEAQDGTVNGSDGDLLKYIKNMKPTKVIINPPYENNNSIKFTKQALDYLEPNGKLIIIMPTPTLTKNHGNYTDKILKIAKLDFIIKMPYKLFSEQNRSVNTAIFGFTKTPHNPNDDVLFYNLEDDGFVSIQHKGKIDKHNGWGSLEQKIFDAITNGNEIANTCVKRKIYKDSILNCAGIQSQANSTSGYAMVKVNDLFKSQDGILPSNECDDCGDYPFITASEEWKTHSSYSHEAEAIVYAASAAGSLGRTHYVNGKFNASNLCFVLESLNTTYPINMQFYNFYFSVIRKQIVSDLADGASKLTIAKKDFGEYYIEYIPKNVQDAFVKKNLDKLEKARKQLKIAEDSVQKSLSKLL